MSPNEQRMHDEPESLAEINKATARRLIRALNEAKFDEIDRLTTHDYVCHAPGFDLYGSSEMKAFVQYLLASFPDARFTIDHIVAEGDFVALHCTLTATHHMDFMGIPARGAGLHLPFITLSRVVNGKVAEEWDMYDSAELRMQLEAATVAAV